MDVLILGADGFTGLALARELARNGHQVYGLGFNSLPHSSTAYRSRMRLSTDNEEAFHQVLALTKNKKDRPRLILTDHPRAPYFIERAQELSLYTKLPLGFGRPIPSNEVQGFLFHKYSLAPVKTYHSLGAEDLIFPIKSRKTGKVYREGDLIKEDPGPFETYIKSSPGRTRLFLCYFNLEGDLVFYGSARGYGDYPLDSSKPTIFQTKTHLLDAALLAMAKELDWRGYLAITTKEDPYTKKQYVLSMTSLPGPFTFLFQRAGLPLGQAFIGQAKTPVKMMEGQWGRLGQKSVLSLYQHGKEGRLLDLPLFSYIPLRSFGPLWTLKDPGVGLTNSSQTLELIYRGLKRRWKMRKTLNGEV